MHFRCARRQERADALHADEKCWAAQAVCGRATGPLFDHWFREFNIVQTPAIRPRCSTPPRLVISILFFIIPTFHRWLSRSRNTRDDTRVTSIQERRKSSNPSNPAGFSPILLDVPIPRSWVNCNSPQ